MQYLLDKKTMNGIILPDKEIFMYIFRLSVRFSQSNSVLE
jgi:hypothetical protein